MAEKIEVKVNKQILIEQVEGGLYFVSTMKPDGKIGERTAASSAASLVKVLTGTLGLVKAKRAPRKDKTASAAPEAPATNGK